LTASKSTASVKEKTSDLENYSKYYAGKTGID